MVGKDWSTVVEGNEGGRGRGKVGWERVEEDNGEKW